MRFLYEVPLDYVWLVETVHKVCPRSEIGEEQLVRPTHGTNAEILGKISN